MAATATRTFTPTSRSVPRCSWPPEKAEGRAIPTGGWPLTGRRSTRPRSAFRSGTTGCWRRSHEPWGSRLKARAGSGEEGKQVVREVAGISPELIESMSSRRAEIRAKINRLATEFQTKHGRPPTVKETYKLSRWAHEHTRKEKAEPRSLNDQLATWTPRIDAALADEASPVPGGASGLFAHAQRASARARERQNAAPKPTSPRP
ncbi:relaxase domain-containing protein (plasmid) [Dermacoccus abyssi]|uniref:Relaxase domain-containing protein n=1 Tax=Dermacoccus abyssi TaxID=322596 RepID=A0ABX5ZDN2_9MICO|nr:relaxase domain-containing protein [Dermacoccus abyssi]